MGKICGLLCIAVLALARSTYAAPVTVPIGPAGVQLSIPSEWKTTRQGNTATIVDPTGNAFVSLTLIPGTADALKKAKDTFAAELKKIMLDVSLPSDMQSKKLNGLDVVLGDGSGTLKAGKKPVKLGVMLVVTPKKKVLFCFAMVAADKEAALKGPIVAVLSSIAPLTGKEPKVEDESGNTSAAPATLAGGPGTGKGKMSVKYAAPGDAVAVRKAVREEAVFEKLTAALSTHVKLPHDIPVVFDKCGTVNAFYDPKSISIIFCDEFTQFFLEQAKSWKGTKEERGKRLLHTLAFFFLHEVGHALIDQLHIPAVGREEDAADQIAAVMLIQNSETGETVAVDGALSFLSIMQLHKGAPPAFADEHSLDEQRFYNIACLIYGSNPTKYAPMVKNGILPKARATRCPTEWAKVSGAWTTLLKPYMVTK